MKSAVLLFIAPIAVAILATFFTLHTSIDSVIYDWIDQVQTICPSIHTDVGAPPQENVPSTPDAKPASLADLGDVVCDLPRIPARQLSVEDFFDHMADRHPFIVTWSSEGGPNTGGDSDDNDYRRNINTNTNTNTNTDANDDNGNDDNNSNMKQHTAKASFPNRLFQEKCTFGELKKEFGHLEVTLSTSNTYSYDKREVKFAEYLEEYLTPVESGTSAEDVWYMFGDHTAHWDEEFLQHYRQPKYTTALPTALSFGVGGKHSGVPFHFHGPGWSEVLHGRKRWFLYPRSKNHNITGLFDPDQTMLDWTQQVLPTLTGDDRPLQCVIQPGEALYFPNEWYHATLNLDDFNAFISTFADESGEWEKREEEEAVTVSVE